MSKPFLFLLAAGLAGLTACGGGGHRQNAATAAASPAAGAMAAQGATKSGTSSSFGTPSGSPAPVPANMNCGSDTPVWANTRSHVYRMASDPYYGRTKHGQYMCPQQAMQQGYHQANGTGGGGKHHGHRGYRFGPSPAASPAPQAT